MQFKTIKSYPLRLSTSGSSRVICRVPENTIIETIGKSIKWAGKKPFVKISYSGKTGFINARALKGLVIKIVNTGNTRYPKKVIISEKTIRVPQQKRFCLFSQKHGCSLAVVTEDLQFHGIQKNPNEVLSWAKKNVAGWTGSKLTIFGVKETINGMVRKNVATWYPITKNNLKESIQKIKNAVMEGKRIVVEQGIPYIHSNYIVGRSINGKYVIITNGVTKQVTIEHLVNHAIKGNKEHTNWFKEKVKDNGFVIIGK